MLPTFHVKAWYYAWNYQQPITLTYGSDVANAQVMLNTTQFGTLYSAGKLEADCSDLRFTNSTDTGPLTFYTEVCDTTGGNSLVWVEVDLIAPSTTIYMYYNAIGVPSASETWGGKIYLLFDTLAGGWTDDLSGSYAGYFPVGTTSAGTTGGALTHTHTASWDVAATTESLVAGTGAALEHWSTHTHSGVVGNPIQAANNLPPYRDMIFGERTTFIYSMIPADAVALYNGTLASGWSSYASLTNTFPRIAVAAGGTGGATTHTHTVSGNTAATASATFVAQAGTTSASVGHAHAFSGSTNSSSSVPPWYGVVFATSSGVTTIPVGMVALFTVVPPLGWTTIDAGGSFIYGQASFGGTGGSTVTHVHATITITSAGTTAGSAYASGTVTGGAPSSAHTHVVTGSSVTSGDMTPPYLTFILGQRKESLPTVSFGSESYVGTTYTTFTTSATTTATSVTTTVTSQTSTITSLFTSTTFTSVTSTLTSLTTSTTVLTNMPMPGNPVAQFEQVGISLGKWEGSVNQTHTIYGEVTVSAVGSGQFAVSTVRFGAPWITMNQTLNPSCGCYLTINSFAPGKLRFKVSPGLDLNSSLAVVDMAAEAITGTGLRVNAATSLIVHVGTPVTVQIYPGGFTTEQVQLAVTASGSIISLIGLGMYLSRRRVSG